MRGARHKVHRLPRRPNDGGPVMTALAPGSTIGILGGGQLGRMLAMAAAQLGYRCHIYSPESDSIAADVSAMFTCAQYTDIAALDAFAQSCDVVTYEFENVPVEPLKAISGKALLRPGIKPLEIGQDRGVEKAFVRNLGGKTAPFALAQSQDELGDALAITGTPAILKTIRMGYDGKGQLRVNADTDLVRAWQQVGEQPVIVEAVVDFEAEFSVILVRSDAGEIRFWDSTRNVHEGGILSRSSLPGGPLIESQQAQARIMAATLAQALDYVGVFTCEFFADDDGPVFNEMAPRVHNSGHWTIEGAVTSQFENHIRAICNLPLGDTETVAERMEMDNLIGDDANKSEKILSDPAAHLHLYCKGTPSPGRKMGHVTRLYY
jgi:5-(carboxyamino)imidazole ribonucleotide synthase